MDNEIEAMPMGVGGFNVNSGATLQRMQTPYATAISVQRPRDLDKIVKAMERECEYGADSFFYSMVFKSKKGPSVVEGPSIGLAYALARTWGNCAIEMPPSAIQETDTHYMVNPSFVDLENGVTITRAFRQGKEGGPSGRFDPERKQDIAFQVAQSKASRNVICAGIPRWLIDRCVKAAKAAVEKGINAEGVVNAAQKAAKAFAGLGIGEDQLCAKVGRPMSQWTSADVAGLRGDYSAIKAGEATVGDLFPAQDTAKPGAGPVTVESVLTAAVAPPAPVEAPSAGEPAEVKRGRGRPRKVVETESPAPTPEVVPAPAQAEVVAPPPAEVVAPPPAPVAASAPSVDRAALEADLRRRFKAALEVLTPTDPGARQRAFDHVGITAEMVASKNIPTDLVAAAVEYLEAACGVEGDI